MQLARRRLLSARVAETQEGDDREKASRQDQRVPRRAEEIGTGSRQGSSQRKAGESGDPAAHCRAFAHASQ